MKAIVLAAWEWTRLRPLTNTTPKPIIKIFWKPILKHNLENIYKYVTEIIIVVKYQKEKIIEEIWNSYKWVKISYFEQGEECWTAAAIRWLQSKKDVIILNWDSIFSKKDLEKIAKLKWYWALVKKVEDPSKYGIFEVDENDFIKKIVEKPKDFVWDLANVWVYKFSPEIFEIADNISLSPRWEYEITDAINIFLQKNKFKAITLEKDFIDIWYPWDILEANSYFLKDLKKSKISWKTVFLRL